MHAKDTRRQRTSEDAGRHPLGGGSYRTIETEKAPQGRRGDARAGRGVERTNRRDRAMGNRDDAHAGGKEDARRPEGAPRDEHEEESDDWVTRELDRHMYEHQRMEEASEPIGAVKVDPEAVLEAVAIMEPELATLCEQARIDSRLEAKGEEEVMPESEYAWAEESKVRVIEELLSKAESADAMGMGWIAVQRDQVEAIGQAINDTGVSSAQAIAIMMMIVGARIGERRMRDLVETISQATEIPTEAIRIASKAGGVT